MPPGQPVHLCAGCELRRPCKRWRGCWVCVDCHPLVDVDQEGVDDLEETSVDVVAIDDGVEPPVATDGGTHGD